MKISIELKIAVGQLLTREFRPPPGTRSRGKRLRIEADRMALGGECVAGLAADAAVKPRGTERMEQPQLGLSSVFSSAERKAIVAARIVGDKFGLSPMIPRARAANPALEIWGRWRPPDA